MKLDPRGIFLAVGTTSLLFGCQSQPQASVSLTSTLALGVRMTHDPLELSKAALVLPDRQGRTATPCGAGMVLVEGAYCPRVEEKCTRYLTPHGRYGRYRCAEYAPSRCLSSARRQLRFCMDRDEYARPGERLPANHQSFVQAKQVCQSLGKRVCTESEWNFACEGEAMLPYPYGYERDSKACNADRVDILTPKKALKDLRASASAFPRCVSPFGVRNLSGNLEEFVAREEPGSDKPVMKGAYWQPSRNACRSRQTVHGPYYQGTETGFRCCSDAPTDR